MLDFSFCIYVPAYVGSILYSPLVFRIYIIRKVDQIHTKTTNHRGFKANRDIVTFNYVDYEPVYRQLYELEMSLVIMTIKCFKVFNVIHLKCIFVNKTRFFVKLNHNDFFEHTN